VRDRRLYKSATDHVIGGVAGGVAEYLDVDPSLVRVFWVLLALITGGVFLVIYIVMWIVVPLAPHAPEGAASPDGEPAQPGGAAPSGWNANPRPMRRSSGGGSWILGLILITVGLYFLAREYLTWLDLHRLWPLSLVALGILLLVIAVRRRDA
jgi:phage shock protein C